MRSFYYQRGRSSLAALFWTALAIGAGRGWRSDGGFLLLAVAVMATLAAAKSALDAASRQPALKFDRQSIWIRKTWGGMVEMPWRDVHDIAIKRLTIRYLGIVPLRRRVAIMITCEGGTFGARRFSIPASAMGMSATRSAELVAMLKQAHVEAVGEARAAMAAAGVRGWGVDLGPKMPGNGFDADAAVARYLAGKTVRETRLQPAAVPGPPRRRLERPSFGRRFS